MLKNVPILTLLCALALPACSRDESSAAPIPPVEPRQANLPVATKGVDQEVCEDGCADEKCETGKTDAGKSGDACQDGCEDGGKAKSVAKEVCKDGCEKDKAKAKAEAFAGEIHLTPEAVQSNGVKVAQAQLRPLVRTLPVPARVAFNAEATAQIGTVLHGRVAKWHVRLGDTVKKGDPLVVVDSLELGEAQADYLQKQAAAQASVAGVELAKSIWERHQNVYEKTRGVTLTQVQQREAEYKAALVAQQTANGMVLAAKRKLRLLGVTEADMAELADSGEVSPLHTLHAPLAGTVVRRAATLGEAVGPDREALLEVVDLAVVWVLAEVPEAQLEQVVMGAKAWVCLREEDGPTAEGAVTFVAPTVDEATRTIKVRIEVKDSALKSGAFVMAKIATNEEAAPVLAIPKAAVQDVGGKSVVFVPVKGEANTFVPRVVTLGPGVGDWVQVISGLVKGEAFVTSGAFILKADSFKSSAPGCTDGCGG